MAMGTGVLSSEPQVRRLSLMIWEEVRRVRGIGTDQGLEV
jgi:hypothetical protein